MRKFLLACLFLLFTCYGAMFAQNKTLGVGVTTPNPNAALHVESPTGNQGFILPRLSTAQRRASTFTTALGAPDDGLMVYDTDLNTVFIWNGISWQSTGQVAGGIKLTYPYIDTVAAATAGPDLFALKYFSGENKRVLRLENQSTTNASSTLSVYNAGPGLGAYFQVANPASTNSTIYATTNSNAGGDVAPVAVYGESTGTGSLGGSFRVNNATNTFPALFAETTGTGVSIMAVTATGFSAIQGEATGGFSNGVTGISNSPDPGSFAILGHNNGGGPAGVFSISSDVNGSNAVQVSTQGMGSAGSFEQTNLTTWAPALVARTNGQGAAFNATSTDASVNANAAEFIVQNTTNPRNAVMAVTEGTGSAGNFTNNNASSGAATLFTQTAGTGAALQAQTSTGFAAVYGRRDGATNGNAALFEIVDAANTYPALQVNTSGTGSAINVNHTGATGDAIYADRQGSGGGSAANFRISNSANTASSMYASTNATGGTAIGASNEANGVAFAIWSGGIKITTNVVTTSSITTRASAYRITGGGTSFTLDFGPQDGEVFMIINETGLNITIAGITVVNGEGKTFVVFPGGVIRGF